MRALPSLASLLALSLSLTSTVFAEEAADAAADAVPEVQIEKTHTVECTRRTADGDKVDMHYRGTLAADGTQFDTSYSRGSPFTFTLGKRMVIPGWEQGLLDMCVGDKRTLTIPPGLAYGDRAIGPIPAGSTLVFETELMGIHGVEEEKKPEEKTEEKRDEPEKKDEDEKPEEKKEGEEEKKDEL
ncbi:hypothetical protein AJ80_00335 [Polytolypa hystricis UAMH7299]|uniref:peptidylprolyl isomerase n=1 Tax=Polytolypa hystricis (strain UAMH7299) TaxID=1447883 RepID=A0A2B7Z4M9_POLH7|nr:hypothetical protein AJ80_00335 [Polytolypa hystricis UAMH7299]